MASTILRWARGCRRAFGRLARHLHLAVVTVGLVSLASSIALTAVRGIPVPATADEFSYLLAADTFAHGRLANPPHPLWQHFETVHVIQQPTYASKYPPAPGLAMALGIGLTGRPVAGVWLSTAFASAAVCWMLMGWLAPRWALFGGLMAAFHPLVMFWSQSYWGGAMAIGGGALLLGALPRLLDRPRPADGVCIAIGIAILLNSRPYEGGCLALAAAAVWLRGWGSAPRVQFPLVARQVLVAFGLVLAIAGAFTGYYNYRVTGDPLLMPYMVHHDAYEVAPLFIWQKPRPEPVYRHRRLREQFVVWGLLRRGMPRIPVIDNRVYYFEQSSIREFFASAWRRGRLLLYFAGHPELVAVLLFVAPVAAISDRRFRRALAILAVFAIGLSLTTFMMPQYAAPGAALVVFLAVQALRHLRLWRPGGSRTGRSVATLVVIVWAVTTAIWSLGIAVSRGERFGLERQRLVKRLLANGDRHLVLVRYPPAERFDLDWPKRPEWVYNGADIDSEPVVWAREMRPEVDRPLLEYFRDRRIWLFEPEQDPPRLEGYPGSTLAGPR